MLKIATDKIAEIIILAREMPRGESEFDGFVGRLDEEEEASLVAVFWIGRGSFEPEDYEEAYATARREASAPTQDYLKGSPHLADHLENGLDALGISAKDAEDDLY
ncbi:DUF3775 domain-containing protein [Aestuariibius sp. HNIBRBA575]|uniref:DUF3775 domain-containing protein n=1 Tax=Aestuariibius sp. HNIBRBA575 TaxID=3233343 RepID=UPI0034A1F01C